MLGNGFAFGDDRVPAYGREPVSVAVLVPGDVAGGGVRPAHASATEAKAARNKCLTQTLLEVELCRARDRAGAEVIIRSGANGWESGRPSVAPPDEPCDVIGTYRVHPVIGEPLPVPCFVDGPCDDPGAAVVDLVDEVRVY